MYKTTFSRSQGNRPFGFCLKMIVAAVAIAIAPGSPGSAQPDPGVENAGLTPFESPEDFLGYLKEGMAGGSSRLELFIGQESESVMAMPEKRPDTVLSMAGDMSAEPTGPLANTVKTDGRFLYVAPHTEFDLSFSLTSVDAEEYGAGEGHRPAIRVYELIEEPPEAIEIGAIGLDGHRVPVSGLHLFDDMDGRGESLLVTVGRQSPENWYFWSSPGYWRGKTAEVAIYDVGSPDAALPLSRLTIEGQLIATQRSGNTLYVLTRFTPAPEGYVFRPTSQAEAEANRRLLEGARLSDLLPGYSIDDEPQGSLVETQTCFLAPTEDAELTRADLFTLTAIDVADPRHPVSNCVAGLIETIHMAGNALYLATTRSATSFSEALTGFAMDGLPGDGPVPEGTDIHKFDLSGNEPIYRGSGTVAGRLKGTVGAKRFSMHAHEDVLRTVTFHADENDAGYATSLSLLKEVRHPDGLSSLEETARLENLEEIAGGRFELRFSAALGYLKPTLPDRTIRLIDLADPARPKVAGVVPESAGIDRLVPAGSGYYIGIGRENSPDIVEGGGYPADQTRGVELLLVNAGNPANPVWVDTLVIGKQGTDTDARFQPQSLYVAPGPEGASARLALPIRLYDRPVEETQIAPEVPPGTGIEWVHTGLYLFDVFFEAGADRTPGFEPTDILTAARASDGHTAAWVFEQGTDRVLVLADSVYYIHRGEVRPGLWGPPGENSDGG